MVCLRSRSSAYVIRKDFGKFLRDRCELGLRVERNLVGAISHAVPDFNVAGELSSVHCSIDVAQVREKRICQKEMNGLGFHSLYVS